MTCAQASIPIGKNGMISYKVKYLELKNYHYIGLSEKVDDLSDSACKRKNNFMYRTDPGSKWASGTDKGSY